MPSAQNKWPEHHAEFVRQKYAEGWGALQISIELGMTRAAVESKMKRMGVVRRGECGGIRRQLYHLTPEQFEVAKQKWAEGYSSGLIAKEIGGISSGALVERLRKLGIERTTTKRITAFGRLATWSTWNDERDNFLKQKWLEGHSAAVVATEINAQFNATYTRSAIIGRLHRLKCVRITAPKKRLFREYNEVNRNKLKRAAPRIKTAVVSIADNHKFLAVGLLDLGPDQCRYPLGDGPFLFCGQKAIEGESYCPHCWRITHQPRPHDPRRYVFAA